MWSNICLLVAVFAASCKGGTELYSKQKLIYGGSPINITQAPYMAQYFSGNGICGATIIHKRFAISASHCYKPAGDQYVRVGSDKRDQGERYDIQKSVVHPGIEKTKIWIDAVVLMLSKPLQLSDSVRPIKMAPQNLDLKSGEVLITMGFGKTEIHSPNLLSVKVPYITNKNCSEIQGTTGIIETRMCAGGIEGEGICMGDSGGPLVYNDLLVGIASYLHKDCGWPLPVVYTRVSAIRDFIDKTIDENNSDEDKLV